jgi:hypothetical protein
VQLRTALATLLVAAASAAPAGAQPEGLLQLGDDLQTFLERQQVAGNLPGIFLDLRPISASEATRALDTLAAHAEALSDLDRELLARYRGEAPGPGVGRIRRLVPALYRDGEHLASVEGDGYRLILEPLGYFALGPARQTEGPERDPSTTTWQNTRGIRAAGRVGRHFFFETRVEENQRQPVLNQHSISTAPRLGDVKLQDGDTYDYWRAAGVVGYRDRFLEARFGHDRNRWGYGGNSLLLSDFSPSYDQLQLRLRVWRLQYVSMVMRRTDPRVPLAGRTYFPSSYGAFHQLSMDLPAGFEASIFESVVFDNDTVRARGFELAYLNPIIFYRPIEAGLGSPDNVLLGAGLAWAPVDGLRTYGELFLDELTVGRLGTNWWGNKFAMLIGAHAAIPGVQGLDARVEYARLRPYMYSHRTRATAYIHYDDPLGHPAGPNAEDVTLQFRYRPLSALHAALDVAYTRRGRNTDSLNFGGDPRVNYDTRVSDDAPFLQGVRQSTWLVEGRIGYEVAPNLLVEGALVSESLDDAERGFYRYVAALLQLRWGLPFRSERW